MSIELLVTGLLTITGLIVGWFLNELSSWFKLRREDRASIGNTLVVLAEIRFRLSISHVQLAKLKEKTYAPAEVAQQWRQMLDELLPQVDSLNNQYEKAVYHLAGRNPNLAYRLHSKNLAPTLLKRLRQLASGSDVSSAMYEEYEAFLVRKILPKLDEIILELAKIHGSATHGAFEKRIIDWKDEVAMGKEVDDMLTELNSLFIR